MFLLVEKVNELLCFECVFLSLHEACDVSLEFFKVVSAYKILFIRTILFPIWPKSFSNLPESPAGMWHSWDSNPSLCINYSILCRAEPQQGIRNEEPNKKY